jgi:hypothetical protein
MSTLRVNQIQTDTGKPILNSTGSILQVVQATSTAQTSTLNTFPNYFFSGLSASITPSSSTSKILILITGSIQNEAAGGGTYTAIFKNGSVLWGNGLLQQYSASGNNVSALSLSYLDSPATTSSTTYQYYYARYLTAGAAYFNGGTIQLLEVSG